MTTIREEVRTNSVPIKAAGSFPSRIVLGLALLAVFLRLFFWFYTQRTWEDALITVQHAENAARGLGLTHTPQAGAPLHGFTSPISVLIPFLGEFLHPGFGLPLLKLLSALLGGMSVWLGMRIAHLLGVSRGCAVAVGGFLAIEHHQILFGMAGMETQAVVAILLFSFFVLFDLNPKAVGISLGLCMLARPDFIFWLAIVFGLVARRCWIQRRFRPLLAVSAGVALVYGPWLLFTTSYYGSPVPNTILAKAYGYNNHWYASIPLQELPIRLLWRVPKLIFGSLGPAYGGNGFGFQLFADHGLVACAVVLLAAPGCRVALRRKDTAGLGLCGFILVYALYYMFAMTYVYGWYSVPLAAATILASALGTDLLIRSIVSPALFDRITYCVALGYLTLMAVYIPVTFRGERQVQEFVENGNRKPIGEYLAAVMAPDQTVGSESLGYIGYYSRRIVYDYPGLCSRKVTQYVRDNPEHRGLLEMVHAFRPDYLVLRSEEVLSASASLNGWLREDYELVREFRVPEAQVKRMLFPQNYDLAFHVYKRKSSR